MRRLLKAEALVQAAKTLARRSVSVPLVVALATVMVTVTPIGSQANYALFFEPAMKLRREAGLLPPLDPRLAAVLVGDKALQRLGRQPTFGEWYGLARAFFDRGVRRVLLLDIFDLQPRYDLPTSRHERGLLALAATVYHTAGNPRASDAATLPTRVLRELEKAPSFHRDAAFVMRPHKDVMPFVDLLGSLNLGERHAVPLAFRIDDQRLLPNIAILAAEAGPLLGADATANVVFESLALADVYGRAVSAGDVFEPGEVFAPKISSRLADRLADVETVLFVPEAYSGARFVEDAGEKVPAFVATLSLANGVITGRTMVHWSLRAPTIVAWAVLMWWLLRRRAGARGLAWPLAALLVLPLLAMAVLHAGAVVLPAPEMMIAGLCGLVLRACYEGAEALVQRTALQRELEIGRSVQELFQPAEKEWVIGDWSVRLETRPYGPMSGDWMQVFAASDREQAVIAIGDVVGKGASAALVTAVIASTWERHAISWREGLGAAAVEGFVHDLHAVIFRSFKGVQSTTLSVVFLDGARASVVCCGAPRWFHLLPRGACETLRTRPTDMPGVHNRPLRAEVAPVDVATDGVLLAVTDGVLDGTKARTRFASAVATAWPAALGADDWFKHLASTAIDAGRADVHDDDMTFMAIRRVRAAAEALPASA